MGYMRYLVGALIALLFTLYTWLGAGTISPWLRPWALWMALLIAEVALLLPEQRRQESLFDARQRVWRGLIRDPLTWVSISLWIFLTLQWLNASTFLQWDSVAKEWIAYFPPIAAMTHPDAAGILAQTPLNAASGAIILPPYFDWLPRSLRADEARIMLDWFIPILTAILALRHATNRHTKRLIMVYVCVMTSVLAIAGMLDWGFGTQVLCWGREAKAYFFATFGYPNHAACFFPAVMLVAMGMLCWTYEHRERTRMPAWLYVLTIALCAISAILSGSRAGVLFVFAITGFAVVYLPIRFFASWSGRKRLFATLSLLMAAIAVMGTLVFRFYVVHANQTRAQAIAQAKTEEARIAANALPAYAPMPAVDAVIREIAETDWALFFENPMLMRSGYQGILALRQHADYPWTGAGARSFRHLSETYIDRNNPEEADWFKKRLGIGQANVHNDTLQFLAEHGWIGFGLMLACCACLLWPFLVDLFTSPSRTQSDSVADRGWFNRLNAFFVFGFLATQLIAVHSFMDLVFRSPACMMLYGLIFVCAAGFIPPRKKPSPPTTLPQS